MRSVEILKWNAVFSTESFIIGRVQDYVLAAAEYHDPVAEFLENIRRKALTLLQHLCTKAEVFCPHHCEAVTFHIAGFDSSNDILAEYGFCIEKTAL